MKKTLVAIYKSMQVAITTVLFGCIVTALYNAYKDKTKKGGK